MDDYGRGVDYWVAAAFFALAALGLAILVKQRWELRVGSNPNQPPTWWVLGPPAWRAWVRSEAPLPLFCAFGSIFMFSALLGASRSLTLVFAALWTGSVLVQFSTALFAWPKFLIYPHLRNQPSFIGEVLLKRQAATAPVPANVSQGFATSRSRGAKRDPVG